MSRVKTQEELDQEARDEALARQLQAEADQNEQRAAQQLQQPSTSSNTTGGPNRSSTTSTNNNNHQQGTTFVAPPEGFHSGGQTSLPQLSMPHVRCTKCNAINTIQPAKSQLQQLCGQCQKLLPPLGARQQQQPGNGTGNYPASTPNFSNPPRPSGGGAGGDQTTTTTTNVSGSSNSAPTLASTNDGIVQGSVQTQQVQARCGQCQSINSLPVPNREPGTTISFRCGQCQAVNRVSM